MTNRNIRLFLNLAGLGLLTGSVAVVGLAFRTPKPPPGPEASVAATRSPPATGPTRPLTEFAPLWRKRLSRPLHDPPAAESEKKPKKDATGRRRNKAQDELGVQLIGTVLESGKSMAILVDPKGSIRLRGVGDTLEVQSGSMHIKRIELEQVTLSQDGRTVLLRMQSSRVR